MSCTQPSSRQVSLMASARSKATFEPRQLTYIIYDGEENVRKRDEVFARIESLMPNFGDPMKLPSVYGNADRSKLYHDGLAYGKLLLNDARQRNHTVFEYATHRYALGNSSPFGLHPMFISTLKQQASPEQLAYWLPLAESNKIIGAYCQTELGHGSFLRGLETTATFDHTTDEFIIHSPTVSSTKYWPGGLGYTSSHAVVMARLIIGGKDRGVHLFIVQLRSLEDHKPMPGIELGDIGLKWGLNSNDNGYAIFTHVHIPREQMLMGNARVLRDGTYIKAAHDKLAYSTMLSARYAVLHTAAFQLAQAVTIATRYSVVREQGVIESNSASRDQEASIMHYKSQHYRLLSRMSQAYALVFAAKTAKSTYDDLLVRQRGGDHSGLPYVHATLAALKAYATQVAADGAEDMRKCCGGHGYSAFSGFLELVASLTSTVTLEGEMYVMYQQTARYLLKCLAKTRTGESIDPQIAYLATNVPGRRDGDTYPSRCTPASDFRDPAVQLTIFRHRATRLVSECEALLRHSEHVDGLSSSDAWNLHMMALISAARAHIEYFVLQSFVDLVESTITDPALKPVLKQLSDLFALYSIESPYSQGSLGFFEDGYISPSQLRAIRAQVNALCDELIPNAIALTDAWNFSDASLVSALGKKDGNVYETMLSWARQVPLNVEARRTGGVDVEAYLKYIRPMLNAKL